MGRHQLIVISVAAVAVGLVSRQTWAQGGAAPGAGAVECSNGCENVCCGNNCEVDCCEADCDGNGICDLDDVLGGEVPDCNLNFLPDACELESDEDVTDCDNNGKLDECEPNGVGDCDNNGQSDFCYLVDHPDEDCNGNAIPDGCDIADERSEDTDENGIPDECEDFIHVPDDHSTIQAAINASVDGNIIIVAPGNYAENIEYQHGGSVRQVRIISQECFDHPNDCDPGATTITAGNVNVAVVEFPGGALYAALLEGFTITGSHTGGILVQKARVNLYRTTPRIVNCIIEGNQTTGRGGGVLCKESSRPTIQFCVITNNQARDGGGIWALSSSPTIEDCTISNNTANSTSGAVGGGLGFNGFPTDQTSWQPLINRSTIDGNEASISVDNPGLGGGVYANTIPVLTSPAEGAGPWPPPNQLRIENSVIARNEATAGGGGVYLGVLTAAQIANTTIADNLVTVVDEPYCGDGYCGGAGIYITSSCGPFVIGNSILWGNRFPSPGSVAVSPQVWVGSPDDECRGNCEGPFVSIGSSDVQGGLPAIECNAGKVIWDAESIINLDPEFVNPGGGDYHLKGEPEPSPCIDVGNNAGAALPLDIDREPRIMNGGQVGFFVDMGADEYKLTGCVRDPEWLCDGDVDGNGAVNPVDLGLVQAAFGSLDPQDLCQYDMDCDGQINPVDSGIVQSLFGTCDPPRAVCD